MKNLKKHFAILALSAVSFFTYTALAMEQQITTELPDFVEKMEKQGNAAPFRFDVINNSSGPVIGLQQGRIQESGEAEYYWANLLPGEGYPDNSGSLKTAKSILKTQDGTIYKLEFKENSGTNPALFTAMLYKTASQKPFNPAFISKNSPQYNPNKFFEAIQTLRDEVKNPTHVEKLLATQKMWKGNYIEFVVDDNSATIKRFTGRPENYQELKYNNKL